jgi:hypothetical protein
VEKVPENTMWNVFQLTPKKYTTNVHRTVITLIFMKQETEHYEQFFKIEYV